MSQMEINRVLDQIRSLSAQVKPGPSPLGQSQQTGGPSEFASILKKGVDAVNQTEQRATDISAAFERGTPGVELPQVMLEVSKASVSIRALSEVRNRLVSAYQDIMNMQM
jgi:flagellar hook-basal body complex protein FliE